VETSCAPSDPTEDDVYEGYFVPRGSIIMPNVWAMCHDPELYPNPTQFKPERYLSEDGQHELKPCGVRDEAHVFGFGRRNHMRRYSCSDQHTIHRHSVYVMGVQFPTFR